MPTIIDWRAEIRHRLTDLRLEPAREAAIVEELAQDLDDCYAEALAKGATPEEARRAALAELSSSEFLARQLRHIERRHEQEPVILASSRRSYIIANLLGDLRYGVRTLRRTPGFTVTALLTLAICIGANLTIFAIVDAVLLRPLPFPDAGRLVTIFNSYPKAGVDRDGSSFANYYERRGKIGAVSELAIVREGTAVTGESGATQREPVLRVSPEFFAAVGRGPLIGRSFNDDEMTYRTDGVTILSAGYWREHFNGDPNVIGNEVRVDGMPKRVIGVLPADFRYLSSEARLYLPLSSDARDRTPDHRHSGNSLSMIARLKPGATIDEVRAQIAAQDAALADSYPQAKVIADAGFRTVVLPLRADHVASIRPTLLLVQAGVLLLLLIGGVNLINLLLIRASHRSRDLAIRQSLGASRSRVVSQVLAESVLLSVAGGLLGLAVAATGVKLLIALGANRLPLGTQVAIDSRLALAALAASLVTGIVRGLPIATFYLRTNLANALQSESRSGTANRGVQRLRHSFVVAQIALALVLLSGAGLLNLSLKRVMAVSPGFRPEHVLSGRLNLPWKSYGSAPARIAFADRLTAEIEAQPGVVTAGVITNIPLSGSDSKSAITPRGYVPGPGEPVRAHYSYGVSGDYFAAIGIPLREGRFLTTSDTRRSERLCVVDEDFASRYWPQGSALGQQLFQDSREQAASEAATIVGVVGAVKQAGLTEGEPLGTVYFPYDNHFDDKLFVVVRTAAATESMGSTLQAIVRGIDPELPVSDLRTMGTRIAESLVARRSSALLIGLFAGVALLLTAIGTFGVLSYAVAQRQREIGIRIALGARPREVGRQFLSVGLRLLAAGSVVGALGSALAGRVIRTVLSNVPSVHLATLAAAVGILSVVALLACLIPARRAARVDPMIALRSD